jgi:pyruvate formate lyase activating enzyme
MKEAYLYKTLDDEKVRCDLCSFRCVIENGERGQCAVRENRNGKLYSLVYGKAIAKSIDPIEKKPLFHFLPGSKSFSIATVGCNFRCLYCQNHEISQYPLENGGKIAGEDYPPQQVVEDAIKAGCKSIAYTYTEPTIFFEYAIETAKIAKDKGLKNIFVTNGYMTKEAIDMMDGLIDAANIDIKSFSDAYYLQVAGGARLKPVLNSLEYMKKKGIWVEATTLIIPNVTEEPVEMMTIADHLYSLDPAIPWHISRFFPSYKMDDVPPTDPRLIQNIAKIAKSIGLKYVYTGNLPGDGFENTYCPKCGELLIKRYGFDILENRIIDGKCPKCDEKIDIVEG